MPVSGDVVTLSFSLAVNNTTTGFWGNLIQAMNDNQGAITAIVGMLTVSVLVFQLWIMCRQADISKEQARISNRANEISREVAFLPTQGKILWDWIEELNNIKKRLYSISQGMPDQNKTAEFRRDLRSTNANLSLKSERYALFFPQEVAEEMGKYSSIYDNIQELIFLINKRYHYIESLERGFTEQPSHFSDEEYNYTFNKKPEEMYNEIFYLNKKTIKLVKDIEIAVISKLNKNGANASQ